MSTYTLYSDPSDGRIQSSDSVYATARAGAALSVDTTAADSTVGQRAFTSYFVWQTFLAFDTSGVVGTVTSATLSLGGQVDNSLQDFIVEARLHDWGVALTTADWVAGADLAAKTLLASWSTAGYVDEAYNALTSEAAFTSSINQSGMTRLMLASSRQRLGSEPTGNEMIGVYLSEQTGTSLDPKLVIVTSDIPATPAAATTSGMSLQAALNAVAGTAGLDLQGAANALAGLTGLSYLDLVGALNVEAGNARANWKELAGVLEQLGFVQEGP